MKVKADKYDVGVLIARFQVHELHQAHKDLINTVLENHDRVLLFLGNAPVKGTRNNPLDFHSRKQMVLAEYPQLEVSYINDLPCDEAWSERLDGMIEDQLTPSQTVVLYGGRDSFIRHYYGDLPVIEFEPEVWFSGTEVRQGVAAAGATDSIKWRAGAIWATSNRYPTVFTTVDVALFNEDGTKILLAHKKTDPENRYRFVGGFASVDSASFEDDAIREVTEETGLEISPPQYLWSGLVDDWRYRGEQDKIKTLLFGTKVLFGTPTPGDDLKGGHLKWFDLDGFELVNMVAQHKHLFMQASLNNPFIDRGVHVNVSHQSH